MFKLCREDSKLLAGQDEKFIRINCHPEDKKNKVIFWIIRLGRIGVQGFFYTWQKVKKPIIVQCLIRMSRLIFFPKSVNIHGHLSGTIECSILPKVVCPFQQDIYFGSTLAVASSRTNILFFLMIALAKQTNCLWPTDRLDPPSHISAFKPLDNPSMALVNWTWSKASQISTSLCSSKGSKFFLKLDANRNGSGIHEKILYSDCDCKSHISSFNRS